MENVPHCEAFKNEIQIETFLLEEENPNLQTQKRVVPKNEIKITKLQLEKLMYQRKKWRPQQKCIMLVILLCE